MEIFKDIKGYEGLYQISNLGNVKSLKFNKQRILKSLKNGRGYLNIRLYKNDINKTYSIHRLVALNFIPNPKNKPDVNHINAIKTDNRIDNLEWTTTQENVNHAFKLGLIKNRKLTYTQAIEIRESNLYHKDLAVIYGIHKSTISYIKLNKTYKK